MRPLQLTKSAVKITPPRLNKMITYGGAYHQHRQHLEKKAEKNITFPFKTERYCYSKKELLKECDEYIKNYTKNINRAILNAKNRIKEEEERLKKLEDLLLN